MRSGFVFKTFFTRKSETVEMTLMKMFIISIFLPLKVSNVVIIVWGLHWILTGGYKSINLLEEKNQLVFLFVMFYLYHLIGLLYSNHLYQGYKEVEKKLPLLAMPLLLMGIGESSLIENRKKLLAFFLKASIFFCLYLLVYGLYKYIVTGDTFFLYYIEFAKPLTLNPIYVAAYLLFALCAYFFEVENSALHSNIYRKITIYLFTLLLLMLLSSKNSILIFFVISITYLFRRAQTSKRTKIIVAFSIVLLIFTLTASFSVTRERVLDMFNSNWSGFWDDSYTLKATSYTGPTLRLSFWKLTIQHLYKDGLILHGVGTGDSETYLNDVYGQHGLLAVGFANYNLHNTFMEVLLEFGLVGLTYFLAMLFMLLRFAVKQNDTLFILLLFIFISFGLTESLFNVNKGLAFFSFFFSLMIKSSSQESQKNFGGTSQ